VISGTPSASDITFQETQQVPGQFPNPAQNATGDMTVSLAPSGGVLSFDTGPQSLTWNTASGAYTFDGTLTSLGNNFGGSYSLITDGQTYSGSFTYGLSAYIYSACTFNTVSTIGYPNSLTLSGLGLPGYNPAEFTASPSIVADVAAANGFNMELHTGVLQYNEALPGEYFSWGSQGTVTATLVVPEPASLSLLAVGMFGISLLRRYQR